ncbi:MAG: Ig-like domain-containing protein [Candidatus Thiodiazotropha lotti]
MKNRRKQQNSNTTPVFEELEPRILLNADLPGLDSLQSTFDQGAIEFVVQDDAANSDIHSDSANANNYTVHKIILVDENTPDHYALIDDILAQADDTHQFDIFLVSADRDGIDQISEILSSFSDLDAVHLISHAEDGVVQLGNTTLDSLSLQDNLNAIQAWGNSFSEDGDLLIYGCNLAATENGQSLVDSLASLTGADVAASDDLTGHESQGGDWDLEYRTGDIEAGIAISENQQAAWQATLATAASDDFTSGNYSGGSGWSGDWTEVNGDGNIGTGAIQVNTNQLILGDGEVEAPVYVQRIVDLSGAGSATLDFDWGRNGESWDNLVSVAISTDGTNWTPLTTLADGSSTSGQHESIDISAHISATTYIRFVRGAWGTGEHYIDNVQITYNAASNIAPSLDSTKSPSLDAVNEDAGAPSGAVGSLISSLVDFASPVGQVDNITDPDAGALLGIAVTAADTTNGTWYYSTNNGTNWNALGAVSEGNARLLAADSNTRLYFQPDADYNGTIANAVTFRAWDQTSGANGSTADLLTNLTIVDQFTTAAYSNNDGSVNWNGNWTEFSDDSSASSGNIQINSGSLYLDNVDGGDFESITRAFDLTGAASSTLTFDFSGYAFSGTDAFAIEVSNNGGSTWTRLEEIAYIDDPGSNFSGGRSFDLQTYLSLTNDMVLRFQVTSGFAGAGQHVRFDNVQITVPPIGGHTAFSSATDTASLTVNPVNDAPTAANNTVTTNEDTTYTFADADFNFSDIDGDTLASVKITTLESVGALQLNGVDVTLNQVVTKADIDAGNLKFVPIADANGAGYDSFGFSVNDGTTDSVANYTMTVDVTTLNDAPTAANNTVSTNEDTVYTFSASDFNFSDIDGDTLASVKITTLETVGALQLSGVDVALNQVITKTDIDAGNLKFIPVANANGAGYDSFGFSVNDGTADSAATYTMTVDVTAVNDAPTAANNTVTTNEDTTYTFAAADFGFSDIDGDTISSVKITTLETVGALQLSGVDVTLNQVITKADIDAGNLKFVPIANANGASYDSFGFSVNDGTVDSVASYTMTVDVTAVNDAPTASDNTVTTNEDTTYTFTAADFNFGDIDGDTLANVKITTLETVGALQLSGVDVTLNQVITKADIDAGNLKFVPVANANGVGYDSFGFSVNDGTVDSVASYTMTVDVTAVNDAPTAANNTVTTNEDTSYTFTAADFNFSDIDGDTLASLKITSLESVGGLQLSGVDVTLNQVITKADIDVGNLKFVPVADANGASYDSFDFSVNDGTDDSVASYTMTMDVTAVNDAPTAANNTVSTNEDTTYTFTAADFNFSDVDGDTLASVKITTLETVGSLQLSGVDVTLNQVTTKADIDAGNLTFVPVADANGASYDSFGFSVNDGTTDSAATYTMTVDVTAVNDAPTAASNTVTTSEDTTYTFTAADFNFSDIDGDTLASVEITTLETVGALQLSGVDVILNQVITKAAIDAGNLKFVPVANANGASYDNFGFSVNDGTVDSVASYTMTVDVTAVNDAPTAANNTVTTNEDTTYTFTAADFSFSDIDGDTLASVKITTLETVGELQLSGVDVTLNQVITKADIDAGNLQFVPVADANGAGYDSFGFSVNDGSVDSVASYTMTVDVTAVNDAPTAANNTVSTNEDTTYTFTAADFSFSDIDGDTLASVKITTLETVGELQLSGVDVTLNQVITKADIDAGNLKFVPVPDTNGASYDSFGFSVNDGTVDSVASYTMTMDVTAVNDAPTAANNTVTTNEDTSYTFTAADFNFSDIDGDTLASVKITTLETVGALQLSGVDVTVNQIITKADIDAGNLKFVPVANANGAGYDSFGFSVNDGTVDSAASYTMTVDVTAVNDAPTAANNTVTTNEDTTYTFTAADFNFSDIDGDTLASVKITSLENIGALQLSGVDVTLNQVITKADIDAGNLKFIPIADANGASYDSFGFSVNDGTVDSAATYTMTVDVTAVNDAPTAANNTVTTNEDTTYTFTAADFNFSDIDGDTLASVKITTLETVGALQLSGVDVTLNQVITKADIDAGNLKFVPVADANGAGYDSFGFSVNDGTADSAASYTMTVDVTAVNDAPTAANNTVTTNEDTSYTFTAAEFNFSDIDGDTLASVKITTLETVGALQLSGVDVTLNQVITKADIDAGNLKFVPVANANGAGYDSFGFSVNDGTVDSAASYTMTVDVTAVNDTPTAANNTVTTNEDTTYTFTAADFNFSDIDGDSLASVKITSLESVGALQLSGVDVTLNQVISKADIDAGNLKFIPVADANGVSYDSFGFSVNDGAADSAATYTMTVDVTAVNDAPTAANNTVTTNEDTTYTFNAADFNFSDIDGDTLASVKITSIETVGALQLSGVDVTLNQVITKADIDAGNLKYVPVANANGIGYDSFGFSVNDGSVDSVASYTMTVDVTAVNDAPTAANNTVNTNEDTVYTFSAADFNFSDIDGDTLASVKITSLEAVGALQLSGVDVTLNQVITKADIDAGNLKFTPVANANGAGYDSFGFSVNDGTVDSVASYSMTVNVTAVNDAPASANNTVTSNEDTTYTFTAADFNFSDIDGDTLASVEITTLETVGALQLSGVDVTLNQVITKADIDAGNLKFVPVANANGAGYDSFGFSVNDGTVDSAASYTMTVDVTAVNDAPTAANNTVTTNEDTTYTFTAADFNFSDIDGDTLAGVEITTLESVGALQLSGVDVTLNQIITKADIDAGNLKFVPVADGNGAGYDSFGFSVNDGALDSVASYTMTIDVTAVNDSPTVAINTGATVSEGSSGNIITTAMLNEGDVDDAGAGLTYTVTTDVVNGTLRLNGTAIGLSDNFTQADIDAGLVTYDHNGSQTNSDSFDFSLADGGEDGATAATGTFSFTVTNTNDAPVITSDGGGVTASINAAENQTAVTTVTATDADLDTVTYSITGGADSTLFSIDTNTGVLTFNAVPDFETPADNNTDGTYEVQVTASDGNGGSDVQTISVTVTDVNEAPTAANNTVTTDEDTTYTFTAADFSFSDIDGDTLASVKITSLETVGELQLSGVDVTLNQVITKADIDAGNLKFVPVANANGAGYDSFGFSVNDGALDSVASYTMTIDVTAVNDAPVITSDGAGATASVNVVENTTAVTTVASSDIDGGVPTYSISGGTDAGKFAINSSTGALTFSAAPDFEAPTDTDVDGVYEVEVTVSDGNGGTDVQAISVTVTDVNEAPTAANNTVTTNEDTVYTFSAADFNFSDVDGDTLSSVKITTLETVGALQLSGVDVTLNQVITKADIDAGNLTFVPVADANGAGYDSFGFSVNDGSLDSVASYTMTVDVTAVNDAPTSANNTVSTNEDTVFTFSAADFNFSDIDGDTLASVEITTLETVGALQLSGVDVTLNQVISKAYIDAGNLKFVPVANANGVGYDSFGFSVNDGTTDSAASYTMTIDVTAVNDEPTAANNTVTTAEDTTYTFLAADFNFSDIDGDALASVEITTLETVGALQLSGVDVTLNQVITKADIDAGNLKFVPVANANGAGYDSFGFSVNDGTADSVASYTMTVDVTAVNDAPALDLDSNDSSGQSGADFAAAFTEDGGAVSIADADAVLSDIDSPTLQSLTVTITNLSDGASESLAANTSGTSIVANYNSGTVSSPCPGRTR